MQRRQFITGSAILGMTLVTRPLLVGASGMFHGTRQRQVYRILTADEVNVGTLPVLRAFAGNHIDRVSPFVLFDEFGPVHVTPGSDPLRVDAHPHAGVTPTTYFLEGSGHHKDSLNYDFQIGKGDFMLFSSGRGAIHMEESGQSLYDNGGNYRGFQIWLNTPARYKFEAPNTTVFRYANMDRLETEKYSVRVVLGEFKGARSNIETHSPAFYYHIHMQPDARIDIPTDPTHNAFVYQIEGSVELEGPRQLNKHKLALYERSAENIQIYAKEKAELLVLGGQPHNEPVYSYGPFVMNSEEQIRQCIRNYQSGKMGDPDLLNR